MSDRCKGEHLGLCFRFEMLSVVTQLTAITNGL